MYYYAHINELSQVDSVVSYNEPITDSSYIAITEEQYNDEGMIGLRYDPDYHTFGDVIYFIGSTYEVNYKNTQRTLSGKLDEIDNTIAGLSSGSTTSMTVTLSSTAWVEDGDYHKQIVTIEGLGATQNGVASISQSAVHDEYEQAVNAMLHICGQSAGQITIRAYGDVPTINIPLDIILL